MSSYGPINMFFSQKLIWVFSFSVTFPLNFHFMAEEAASLSEPNLDHPN
jgi:hypothetical protein